MSVLAEERTHTKHPLEPLSPEEIRTAVEVLKRAREITPDVRFVMISLREPVKSALTRYEQEGEVPDREVAMVLRDRAVRRTYEAVVSLSRMELAEFAHRPGAQPAITEEEFGQCDEAVRRDGRWQEAMRRRGVQDFSLAMVDAWPAGFAGDLDDATGRRLCCPLTFVRAHPGDNGYARPVENLEVLVDLDSMEVLDVTDHGPVPLPELSGNYDPQLWEPEGNWPGVTRQREGLRPIDITQPQGPSFTVDGYAVKWQKWSFRIGFTVREGLVLHQVGYRDGGRVRPVVHRASLAEMYTPYGDPGLTHHRKNAFDEGEYGAGFMVNALELGCDCLGEIHYLDAVVHDQSGEPVTLPNAICMHEEDVGVGWKHTDFRTGSVVTRRQRRLVVSSFAVLGNYQYGYFWYLYLDGTVQFEIKLTGMISTGAYSEVPPGHGAVVAPGLYGPHHQHFFNMRLDMSVDGEKNTVYEVDSEPLPMDEHNPRGNAWRTRATPLASESTAQQRLADPATGRFWSIVNSGSRNGVGEPVSYKLVPGSGLLPMQPEGSEAWHRARFVYGHLWVTAYDPAQMYAAGDYPNQSRGGDGLPAYAAADRPLADGDVVLWHTFGEHHVVRAEDWPAMPVVTTGFSLRPNGFFDGNPALDVPPPDACASHAAGAGEGARGGGHTGHAGH
ncbi:primary-amine oxidase [Streptomyces sp. TS71-3]|uniref:primary-amine oxidase n=1 Tax=Streptomyces sp. TS71-3 TaxID=2733862 RepID=UPI001B2F3E10|nr:primary-amine oxidase [Streptomyces sp. TS71-3]GHJ41603.1 amine oxidase [Streptomyces sp. TS71-3]